MSHSSAAAARGGFAAVGPAGKRYRSIAARPTSQQRGAAAANAGSAELSMGPFCATRSNPTHGLTDPTQPTTSGNVNTHTRLTALFPGLPG